MFRRKRKLNDFSSEIQAHIQHETERLRREGLSEKEARDAARQSFGNFTQAEERFHESARWVWWDHLRQDVRYALRTARRGPGFAAVAMVTLALGIGAATSIFSVVKAVIFAPLPFRQPANLVHLWEGSPGEHYHRGDQAYFSSARPADVYDWREQSRSFEIISAYRNRSMLLSGANQAELAVGHEVMDQFFELLGTPAQLGRTLQPSDYEPGAGHVVVISNRMWVTRLGADPGVIGRRISLDRESHIVVGVMPTNFYPTSTGYPEFWVPHWADQGEKIDRKSWGLFPLGRLKPGVSWQQAQIEFDVISARIAKEHPADEHISAVIVPMDAQLIGSSWKLLLLLSGGVTLLLLIACANVANLLLARVIDRQKEFAIRMALGAGHWRIAIQLFIENLALAIAAGAMGFGVAFALTRLLLANLPQNPALPRLDTAKVDVSVLAFVCGITLAASLLFSLVPMVHGSRTLGYNALATEGRAFSASTGKRRLGQVFIVSEFVFSLVLLILGVLLTTSFINVARSDPGFDTNNLLIFNVPVPQVSYGKFVYGEKDVRREKLYEQLERIVSVVPGVESVAIDSLPPLRHEFNSSPVLIAGRENVRNDAYGKGDSDILGQTGIQRVNPDYFHALHLKLISGRFLEERDGPNGRMAAVVNQAFVKAFFPGEDPVGKQVSVWYGKPVIVGVVGDFKLNALDRNPLPEIFWSLRQDPWYQVWVMTRVRSDPGAISASIRSSVRGFDPDLPLLDMKPMTEVISDSLWLKRISALLIGLVAVLAIVLAATGIYSVVSYSVSRRTKEIGIRVALGAHRQDVLRLIMGETLRLALLGSAVGCAAAYFAGRLATSQSYLAPSVAASLAQEKMNPLGFVLSALFLCAVALAASFVPARRAIRVDPLVALRHE